jgi:transglutaminase-like putative cysteine protease
MLFEIRHQLHFAYDDFVREAQMELRVEPSTSTFQTVQAFHLAVGPRATVGLYRDWNGNTVHHLGIRDYHDRIEVESRSVVDVSDAQPTLDVLDAPPGPVPGDLLDFVLPHGPPAGGEVLDALAREISVPPEATVGEQVRAIGELVNAKLAYVAGTTDWRSTAEEALEVGSGVCQDFAHIALGLLRRRGIPALYVSGYLHVEQPSEPAQSHAWIEVYGGRGWVGYDPTHRCTPGARYVRVAVGRHYHDVPPNRGFHRGTATESLETSVETREIEPREVATLRRSAADLEVPAYTELPTLTPERRPVVDMQPPAAPAEQQQQQQQQ